MKPTNNENNRKYRQKFYDAGLKQMRIWVPREIGKEPAKIDKQLFIKRIEAITAGWSGKKQSKIFKDVLKQIKEKGG
jgi:hypothetical protein